MPSRAGSKSGIAGSARFADAGPTAGGILRASNNSWPRSVTGQPKWSNSNVAAYARDLIRRAWGETLQEDEEDRVVGKVRYSDITRRVTVFRAAEEDEPF